MGISKEAMKVGDVLESCGYVLKEGVEALRTFTGKLMDAEMLVMPGGQKQRWSDYGQHLCLGTDFHDFHK